VEKYKQTDKPRLQELQFITQKRPYISGSFMPIALIERIRLSRYTRLVVQKTIAGPRYTILRFKTLRSHRSYSAAKGEERVIKKIQDYSNSDLGCFYLARIYKSIVICTYSCQRDRSTIGQCQMCSQGSHQHHVRILLACKYI
jgi:hypothetical protein